MIDFNKYPQPKKRIRHHTSPNVYLPAAELKVLPDGYPPLIDTIEWKDIFANGGKPNILDIGCGRGMFLMNYSVENPNDNIMGIEVRPTPVEWIKTVIDGEQIPNCGILRYSVANGIHFIDSNSIDKVFYLFPDPWPKTKHHKRRAFNQSFLEEVYRVLKPGAELYLATDVEVVHIHHLEELEIFTKFNIHLVENDSEWQLPITNKERFCREVGIHFDRIIAKKV